MDLLTAGQKVKNLLRGAKVTIDFPLTGCNYCTRTVITRGLYILNPLFEEHFFVLKDVFFKSCPYWYSRAGYDGACTVTISYKFESLVRLNYKRTKHC